MTRDRSTTRLVKSQPKHPIFGLMKRVRSAAGTGRGIHLAPDHVQVLLSEEVYCVISNIEAAEMRKACADAAINDNNVGVIGSGSDRTTELGASAGSNVIPLDAASRGASLLLREEAGEIRRRKKR